MADPDNTSKVVEIDQLLGELHTQTSPKGGSAKPQIPNAQDIARINGLTIVRGQSADSSAIAIPQAYSEREARVEVARHIAAGALKAAEAKGVEVRAEIEEVAAALLMPTDSFREWGARLKWEARPLADTFAVPVGYAKLRSEMLGH